MAEMRILQPIAAYSNFTQSLADSNQYTVLSTTLDRSVSLLRAQGNQRNESVRVCERVSV